MLTTLAALVLNLPADVQTATTSADVGSVISFGSATLHRYTGSFLVASTGEDKITATVVPVTAVVLRTETDDAGKVWKVYGWKTSDGRLLAYDNRVNA